MFYYKLGESRPIVLIMHQPTTMTTSCVSGNINVALSNGAPQLCASGSCDDLWGAWLQQIALNAPDYSFGDKATKQLQCIGSKLCDLVTDLAGIYEEVPQLVNCPDFECIPCDV